MKTSLANLGDIADFVNGVAFKPEDWVDEGRKIIRIQNLTDPSKPYNLTTRKVSPDNLVRNDDMLVSWSATLGVFVWHGPEACVNQHIFKVIPNRSKINDRYLFWALRRSVESMGDMTHGATMKHINRIEFLSTTIPLPPLPDQKRIADILDKADAIREKRKQSIAKMDTLLQSVFLDMFGDPVTNPKGWKVVKLNEILNFLTSGSRGWAKYYTDQGSLFLRIQNIGRGELLLDDCQYVRAPDSAEKKRTTVMSGDVVMSITADLGRTAVIPEGFPDANINQHLAIFRTHGIVPTFLSAYLASEGGQIQIQRANRGGVKAGLNFNDLRSLKILLPPIELQYAYDKAVTKVSDHYSAYRKSSSSISSLFPSLQQRAFKGKL